MNSTLKCSCTGIEFTLIKDHQTSCPFNYILPKPTVTNTQLDAALKKQKQLYEAYRYAKVDIEKAALAYRDSADDYENKYRTYNTYLTQALTIAKELAK